MPASKARSMGKAKNKKHSIGNSSVPVEITLPSVDENGEHNVCLARRPGPTGFIKMGILDSMDTLTGLVSLQHMTEGGSPAQAAARLAENADELQKAMDLIDKVTVAIVVDPPVYPVPESDAEGHAPIRLPDTVYVDDVDMEDKVFLMQWAMGGTADLERFRGETGELVGGMEASAGV